MTPSRPAPTAAASAAVPRHKVELLRQAFHSFDRAAATLQESYQALTRRLERMDLELAASNEALRVNLEENENMRLHLAAILDSLATGVVVADEQGRVTRCNDAAVALLARPRSRILGSALEAVLHDAGLDRADYPLSSPSGARVAITSTRLRHPSGEPQGVIVLLHDVTTIHELEERVQRRDRLVAMGEMVGRIAHEIRNPLGSIQLFASLLRRDLSAQDPQQSYAAHICTTVEGLNRLLSNLLTYTKPDRPRAGWHDTERLLADTLALTAHALGQANIRTPLHLDPEVPAIWCDAAQIKQALVNLMLNAVQAMPGGGTLALSVTRDLTSSAEPPRLCVEVSDTGCGIDPRDRSRIFDPFFTTRTDGTGLGLAIVHAVVEAHGGRIEVASQPGQGTSFRLYLPACPPDAPSDPPAVDVPATLPAEEDRP